MASAPAPEVAFAASKTSGRDDASCRSEGSAADVERNTSLAGSQAGSQRSFGKQSSFGSQLSAFGGSFGKRRTPRGERKDGRTRSITVPVSVAARLSAFRAKRRENDSKELTLSNLLSVTAVQRAMHLNDEGLARDRQRSNVSSTRSRRDSKESASSAPTRLQRKASRGAESNDGFASHGMNAIRDLVDDTRDLAAEVARRITHASSGYDPEAPETSQKVLTFVTPEVNRKIRKQLLRQNWFTNRFQGSAEASRAEAEFAHYTSRYHIKRVRRRLLLSSVCLLFSLIEPLVSDMRTAELVPYLLLKTATPSVALACGSLLCLLRPTRPHWRVHVVVSAFCAYNGVLWSDAVIDVSGWSRASQDYSTVLQCVWMMIASQVRLMRLMRPPGLRPASLLATSYLLLPSGLLPPCLPPCRLRSPHPSYLHTLPV